MIIYLGTTKILFPGKAFYLPVLLLSLFLNLSGQETNSRASGRVYSEDNEKIFGASMALIHEPTQNIYPSITQTDGTFFRTFRLSAIFRKSSYILSQFLTLT